MNISSHAFETLLDILVFKFQTRLVGLGDYKQIQSQGEHRDEQCREYVRDHHPMETDST